jgi:hypothetical protein
VDLLVRRSTTPPTVLLVKPVVNLKASNTKPALLAFIRDEYDAVAAEFGSHVVVADPAAGWDPATMLGSDQLHPNDRGMGHLGNAYDAALASLGYRAGQNTGS